MRTDELDERITRLHVEPNPEPPPDAEQNERWAFANGDD